MTDNDCQKIRDGLSDYLDGRTCDGALDRAVVADHLASCGECQRHLGEIEAVSAAYRPVEDDAPSAEAMDRIITGFKRQAAETGSRTRVLRARFAVAAAAAAVAAAALIAVGLGLIGGPRPVDGSHVKIARPGSEPPVRVATAVADTGLAGTDIRTASVMARTLEDMRTVALCGVSPEPTAIADTELLENLRTESLLLSQLR